MKQCSTCRFWNKAFQFSIKGLYRVTVGEKWGDQGKLCSIWEEREPVHLPKKKEASDDATGD